MITKEEWDLESINFKVQTINLSEKILQHKDFQNLKTKVDKAWRRTQGKNAPDYSEGEHIDLYLVADYPGIEGIQDKIAKDIGIGFWRHPYLKAKHLVVPYKLYLKKVN